MTAASDALGVCGGDCDEDVNGNGICDDEEECLGTWMNVVLWWRVPSTSVDVRHP